MAENYKVMEGERFASALTLDRNYSDWQSHITVHGHPDAKFTDEVSMSSLTKAARISSYGFIYRSDA